MQQLKSIFLLLFLSLGLFCNAQDEEDYLEFNDRKNVVHGVYLGLTAHYGEIKGKDTYLTALKIAYVANQQFEVGFVGTFFYSDQNLFNISQGEVQDLIGGYGGLHLEPILFSKSRVNLSFPLLIGAGGMGYIDDNFDEHAFDEREFEDTARAFFILEPGVNALFNVSRYLQLEAGIKYRLSDRINNSIGTNPIRNINGFSAGLGIKVGIFNMGRNRYKKNI